MKLEILVRKAVCALLPGDWWLKRRTRNGAIVSGLNRPGFGGRGFFIFGEGLEPELGFLDEFLRSGDVFVDVGANAGVFSMTAARAVGETGQVIAVEPLPEMFCTLQRNVNVNGFGNVRLRNLCASDQNGTAEFWVNFAKPNSASLSRRDEKARRIVPLCMTLDELVRMENLTRIDYLKIDAEGAEPRVLKGAAASIARFKPVIQIEVTLSVTDTLAGYERWRYPSSINCLLIPSGHRLIEICQRLDYRRE